MRASELYLIVRAQNQASGALRRVASDLRGLSTMQGLRQRGQSLQIARNQMMLSRQIASNELKSIETGQRSLALQRAKMQATLSESRAMINASGVSQQMRRNEEARIRQQVQLNRINRTLGSRIPTAVRKDQLMLLEAAQMKMATLNRQEEILAQRAGVAAGAISKQALALRELEARQISAGNRADVLRTRIANYGDRLKLNTEDIKANNRALSNARWDKVAAGGRIMQHTARIMEYAGIVLGGSLAYAASYAAKFGTSVTLAATQTRKIGHSFTETAKNSEFLQKNILTLMRQFPASSQEMSAAAYDIYSSLNVSLPGGVKLLKLFNQAAVAGGAGLEEVSAAGITVMNNFRLKVPQVGDAFQTMFAAVRFGRMTFKEFVAMMPQLSPAFAAAGYGLRDMAQAAAFMTRVMPNTRMAGTALARLTEILGRRDFLAGAEKAGVRITDIHKRLLPIPEVVARLVKAFPQLRKAMESGRGDTALQNFFKDLTAKGGGKGTMGTIQARRAFTFFVTQAKLAHTVYAQVAGDQNEFTNSLKAMEKTTGVRWGVFINNLKALALAIGSAVVPALLRMAGPIQNALKWWEKLDDSTKRQISRFAAYSAGIMLIGGAFAFVGGMVIRLFTVFGRFLGMAGGLAVTIALVATAAAALTGNIRSLGDVMNNLVKLGTGSIMGWVTMLTLAAGAAIKLRGALIGVSLASAGGASGGILAGLFGGARSAKAGMSLTRDAIRAKGLFAGLAASSALIPGGLVAAGAAIAVVAAGALLWKHHMEGVARAQAAVEHSLEISSRLAAVPSQSAKQFGQIAGTSEGIERQQIAIRGYSRAIADLRKQLAAAPASQKAAISDQIRSLQLDMADARVGLHQQYAKINAEFDAFTVSFNAQGRNMRAIADRSFRLEGLKRLGNELQNNKGFQMVAQLSGKFRDLAKSLGVSMSSGMTEINRRIDTTTAGLKRLKAGATEGASALREQFAKAVTQLANMKQLPKLPKNAIRDMFNVSLQKGRAITIPEMKAIIRAEIDPKSIRNMPAQLQRQFKGAVKVRIQEDKQATDFKKLIKGLNKTGLFHIKAKPETKAATAAFNKLRTPLHKRVIIDPPPNLAGIGAAISAGIEAGMHPITQRVIQQTIKDPITKAVESHSPSRWAAREVGKPIMQGIIQGILSETGELQKTATIVANIFGGTVLANLDEKKKKITAAVLTKDLQSQVGQYRKFNNALAKLARRGAPKEMIDQLAALGPEAADKIAKLANMTAPQLKRYIRLWQQAQKEIKRSLRTSQEDIRNATKQMKESMMSNLQSTFSSLHDMNVGQFGAIFQGPTNLAGMTGDAFKQAMDEYNSSVSDFQGQIRDLNQQIADAQKEATQRLIDAIQARKDELQNAMGQLFSGDWMQGTVVQTKLDWGKKLGFEDLQKDLESQVTKFSLWRTTLTQLAAKVPPELGKQLEALGPEAVDKLQILNSGSSEQIAAYVALWQQGQDQIMAVANKTTVDTSDITARINEILAQIDDVTQKLGALQMPHQLTAEDIINDLKAQQSQWIEYGDILQSLSDRGLPAELLQQLQALGPEALPYLRVLNTMTDTQLQELAKTFSDNAALITKQTIRDLNTQLDIWFEYGKKIGLELVAGIAAVAPRLQVYFKDLITQIITQMGWPRPSKLPDVDSPDVVNPVAPIGGSTGGRTGGSSKTESFATNPLATTPTTTNYTLTVNQASDESLAATLEKATFRLATRRE